MTDFILNSSDSENIDSEEEELQEAFAKGLLKPGLNEVIEKENKVFADNVDDMRLKLKEIQLKLAWIETLDLMTTVAPMAPDVAMQMQETATRRKNIIENSKGRKVYDACQDPVLNEFKRENLIHRQAQAAVIEGIARLKTLKVPTRRPDDYFAEMAKSDDHMQKIRKNLLTRQASQARSEKVRQLREQKKISKQVQIEAKLKQTAEKKQMLDQLKRVRKGKSSDLGFLENNKNHQDKPNISKKRVMKNNKFGFGGKKKGIKLNTKDSSNDMTEFNRSKKANKMINNVFKQKRNRQGSQSKKQRPGKSRRQNSSKR